MPKNKVRFGLCKLYTAKANVDDYGNVTYEKPIPFPGAVSITEENEGDEAKFWADNMAYFVYRSSTGKSVTLTVAELPEEFKKDYLGYDVDDNGVLVEKAGAQGAYFALLYEFDGDAHETKHALYYCKASLNSLSGETIGDGGTEPQTTELAISALPRPDTRDVKISTGDTASQAVMNGWYDDVYQPANGDVSE